MSAKLADFPSSPPRCSYVVPRKKRRCRMLVKDGHQFCGEHADKEDEAKTESSDRIPCPLDPNHTCRRAKLESHLLKCPQARRGPLPEYCVQGANGANETFDDDEQICKSASISIQRLQIIKKAESAFAREQDIVESVLEHDALDSPIRDPENGPSALKHLRQNASLLGHLGQAGLLRGGNVYLEFGSGRGQLTFWLTRAVENPSKCDFLLIDRASHRHKFDNRLKNDDEGSVSSLMRVRVDIQDLVLDKLPQVKDSDKPLIAVSKHLCGGATDLALRCLHNSISRQTDDGRQESPRRLKGVMIALCCHHRCSWDLFVGKEFLQANGFSRSDFRLLCGLTSWATCGTGRPRRKEDNGHQQKDDCDNPTGSVTGQTAGQSESAAPPLSRYDRLNLCRERREEIGLKAKRILDFARVKYVKENLGLADVKLYYYCKPDISLENVAMVASINEHD